MVIKYVPIYGRDAAARTTCKRLSRVVFDMIRVLLEGILLQLPENMNCVSLSGRGIAESLLIPFLLFAPLRKCMNLNL